MSPGMTPFGLRTTLGPSTPSLAPASAAPGLNAKLRQDPLRTLTALMQRFGGNPSGLARASGALTNKLGAAQDPNSQQLKMLLDLLGQAIQQGQLGAMQQGMKPGGAMSYFSGLPMGAGTSPFAANPGLFNAANAMPFNMGQAFSPISASPYSMAAPGGDLQNLLLGDPTAFRNLVGDWAQTQEGNCSAVAMIKAGMDRHGNNLFDSVTPQGDGVRVRMKDGMDVTLSGQELAQARMAANFSGPQSAVKTYAEVAYAAMAKRAQMEGHEGAQSFGQALFTLANGDDPFDSARFLGLQNNIRQVDPRTLNGQDSVVGWNGRHALFVDKTAFGHVADRYGQPYAFDGTDTGGAPLQVALTVV